MLRFGILTAGHIATAMANTVSQMREELIPWAIAARDGTRAKDLAACYGFSKSYEGYDALFADPQVDIVYIGSTHNFHAQHIRAALEAGKHVLCEKPLCVSAAQAQPLLALARNKGLVLAEATWTRYQPFVPVLRQVLNDGAIGAPQFVSCAFGQPLAHVPRMVQPALAGGALLDLGIYPITMASLVLGGQVAHTASVCVKNALGVDAQESIALRYENGAVANLSSSFLCRFDNRAVIYGEYGRIEINQFWKPQSFTLYQQENAPQVISCPFELTGYEYEVRSVLRAVESGDVECPELPHAEILRVLRLMDALRAEWGVHYPFEAAAQ